MDGKFILISSRDHYASAHNVCIAMHSDAEAFAFFDGSFNMITHTRNEKFTRNLHHEDVVAHHIPFLTKLDFMNFVSNPFWFLLSLLPLFVTFRALFFILVYVPPKQNDFHPFGDQRIGIQREIILFTGAARIHVQWIFCSIYESAISLNERVTRIIPKKKKNTTTWYRHHTHTKDINTKNFKSSKEEEKFFEEFIERAFFLTQLQCERLFVLGGTVEKKGSEIIILRG